MTAIKGALARGAASALRMFISGSACIVVTLAFAICAGFYAKLLWRALRFGWSLV